MGAKRFIARTVPFVSYIDIFKYSIQEKSIKKGLQKFTDEVIREDDPFTKNSCRRQAIEAKKEGYIEASNEYEKKMTDFIEKTEYEQNQLKRINYEKDEIILALMDSHPKKPEAKYLIHTKRRKKNDIANHLDCLLNF